MHLIWILKLKYILLLLKYGCFLLFFMLVSLTEAQKQYQAEYHLWRDRSTGIRLGYGANPGIIEIGLGRIFLDKPCNRSTHRSFGPVCSFPKKFEIDATIELPTKKLIEEKKYLWGQKLTVLYTLMGAQDSKMFGHKSFYYTIGHTLWGCNFVHYTDFNSDIYFFRPEISWMAPQRISLSKRDKLHLNMRITYGFNSPSDAVRKAGLKNHQFSILFLFL